MKIYLKSHTSQQYWGIKKETKKMETKKKEMKEAARKELEDWYKHHKEAIEKTRSANRFVLFLYTYFSFLSNALSISSFNATL